MQNEEGGLKSLNSFFCIFVVQQISNNLDFFRMVKVIVLKQILVLLIFVVVCLMLQPSMLLCCHIFHCWLQFHIRWTHKMAHSDHLVSTWASIICPPPCVLACKLQLQPQFIWDDEHNSVILFRDFQEQSFICVVEHVS